MTTPSRLADERPARILTLGDVVLDVIVNVPGGLHHDDDSEAVITLGAGGQAANVASWVVALGVEATVIGPAAPSAAAALVIERLGANGVGFVGVPVEQAATVVSIVTGSSRTMASDAGDQTWLARAAELSLPGTYDWLHLSAYPLLRNPDPGAVLPLVQQLRAAGARISLDLSSAALLKSFGVAAFRAELDRLQPDLVFANAVEWGALAWPASSPPFELLVKHGAEGVAIQQGAAVTRHAAHHVDPVDSTGAGDALAAGYLVGGIDVALDTAARCVAQVGAQPR